MKRIPFRGLALFVFCVMNVVAVSVSSQEQSPKEQEKDGTPVGLRLTGRAEKNGQSWQFEIVTEGHDYYYRKEWGGEEVHRKPGDTGFWRISLIVGDFGGAMSKSWGLSGARGGGNYGDNGKDQAELARRLWTGDKFTGVTRDELRAELASDHYVEEFRVPVSHDRFSVPSVIRWTDNTSVMPEKTTTYTVEKVEFLYHRNTQFFKEAKARYFPKDDGKSAELKREIPKRAAPLLRLLENESEQEHRLAAADLCILVQKRNNIWKKPDIDNIDNWKIPTEESVRAEVAHVRKSDQPEDLAVANMCAHCMGMLKGGTWLNAPLDARDPLEEAIADAVQASKDPIVRTMLLLGLASSTRKHARDTIVGATADPHLGVRKSVCYLIERCTRIAFGPLGNINIGSPEKDVDTAGRFIREAYKKDVKFGSRAEDDT